MCQVVDETKCGEENEIKTRPFPRPRRYQPKRERMRVQLPDGGWTTFAWDDDHNAFFFIPSVYLPVRRRRRLPVCKTVRPEPYIGGVVVVRIAALCVCVCSAREPILQQYIRISFFFFG